MLSLFSLVVLMAVVPIASQVVTAGPASATGCQAGETLHVESTWTPNPLHHNGTAFRNDVTVTNCTNSSQSFSFGGTVSDPATCSNTSIAFGPIPETLAANASATYTQVVDQPPTCLGTYTQVLNLIQGGVTIKTITVTFSVIF